MKHLNYLLFIIILLSSYGCSKTATQEDLSILNSAMKPVEMVLQSEVNRLKEISKEPEVLKGNWDFIKAELTKNSNDRIKSLYWYALPDGSYYTSKKDKVEANLSNREYFPTLLNGENVVGYPIVGKTSGQKSIVIAVPILVDGKVVGMLASSLYLEEFWDYIKIKVSVPANYDFYAVNSAGITIYDLETKDHFLDKVLNQPVPTLVEAINVIIKSDKGEVSYEWKGKKKIAVYQKSQISDWRYVLSFY